MLLGLLEVPLTPKPRSAPLSRPVTRYRQGVWRADIRSRERILLTVRTLVADHTTMEGSPKPTGHTHLPAGGKRAAMVDLEVTRQEAEYAARTVMRFLGVRGEASTGETVIATGLTEAQVRAGQGLLLEKAIIRREGRPPRWSLAVTPAELALRSSGVLDRPVEF